METSAINADNDPCIRKQIVFAFKVSNIFKPGSMLVQTCLDLLATHFELAIGVGWQRYLDGVSVDG